jgi:tetratricopeptide (TPR) repeat protein
MLRLSIFAFWGSFLMIYSNAYTQTLDEELGFMYVKAEYLYETNRYEEAVVQYNQVISKNPRYKDALLHRGWSKYNLAAYKGAMLDALQSIELKGITAQSAALLGKSQVLLNEIDVAINNLSAACALDDESAELREWRAEIYEKNGDLLKACIDYEEAMKLGSKTALVKAKNLCGINVPTTKAMPSKSQPNTPSPSNTNTSSTSNDANSDSDKEDSTHTDTSTPSTSNPGGIPANTVPVGGGLEKDSMMVDDSDPVVRDESIPIEDNTVNTLEIDDDVSIDIYGQELGLRKITETPSILILNDQNGTVMIHVCVDKSGTVTKAEFNPDFSTLSKKSIVSLAIRKAKEFIFAPGKYDAQCGVMVFKIKGS